MNELPKEHQLTTPIEQLWVSVKDALNQGLLNQHGEDGQRRYEFDFVESLSVNAMAITLGGVSFIGVTTALRQILWNICADLGESPKIAARFKVDTIVKRQQLKVEIFGTVLSFVVCHEYGHHELDHHVHAQSAHSFYSDVMNEAGPGSIEDQGKEIHADGYAVYFVIFGLMEGARRDLVKKSLGEHITNEDLLSLFIIGVAAFFFIGEPPEFDSGKVDTLTHPPAAIRLNYIMYHTKRWCEESRPDLLTLLTLALFQELVSAVKETIWQREGPAWPEQDRFGFSEEGRAYMLKRNAAYDELQARFQHD